MPGVTERYRDGVHLSCGQLSAAQAVRRYGEIFIL